jgi:predicted PurR-regulated permease PerM
LQQYPRLVYLAAVVVVVAALYLGQDVLVPIALAVFLSFILSPLVTRLERLKLGHIPSVLAVAVLTSAAIGFLGWVVGRQAIDIVDHLPEYRTQLQSKVELVRDKVQRPLKRASEVVSELGVTPPPATGDAALLPPPAPAPAPAPPPSLTAMFPRIGSFLSVLGTAGIVIVLTILMMVQRADLRDRFIALAGGGGIVVTTQALDEGARRVSRYLLVLTMINLAHGTVIATGLWLIGVPNFLLWGLLAAILRFIPYLGACVAAGLPLLFSFATSEASWTPLAVLGLFAVVELVTAYAVEPTVLPNHVGVSSTALVISAVFWTWLWGLPGLALATPLTVCLAVLGEHVTQLRFLTVLLGDRPVLSPALRLYQRLLIDDPEDALNVIETETKEERSLVEITDGIVLPALCLAEQDHRDRVIDDAKLEKISQHMRDLLDELAPPRSDPPPPTPSALRVVCVSGGAGADAVAISALVHVLRRAGVEASEVGRGALVSEELEQISARHATAVCVSQLPPLSFSRLRYVCKRVLERYPEMPILIGTWTVNLDATRARERIQCEGDIRFVPTLAEMETMVRGLASTARTTSTEPMRKAPAAASG